jgi:hypothetical protein
MLNYFLDKDKLYLNGDVDYLNNKVSNDVDLKDPAGQLNLWKEKW